MCKGKDFFCIFPFICVKAEENHVISRTRAVTGCIGCCFVHKSELQAIDNICSLDFCKNTQTCISPCFCFCNLDETLYYKGETEDENLNNFIEQKKLRFRTNGVICFTCGKINDSIGPIQQVMEIEKIREIMK